MDVVVQQRLARRLARALRRDLRAWQARTRRARAQAAALEQQLRAVRESLSWAWETDGADSDAAWDLESREAALIVALSDAQRRAREVAP